MHGCSKCSKYVEPSSWYRLTSGYILCGSCWYKSETKVLYRDYKHSEKIFNERNRKC